MKIIIVDDDRLVVASLKTILEANRNVQVVGVGYDGMEAVKLYDEFLPDVLLMDIRMKNMSGLQAADAILKKNHGAKILFLTTFSDEEYIVKALQMGAKGYILKQDFEGILPSLQAVNQGQTVFGGEIVNKLPEMMGNRRGFSCKEMGISEKEYEIIELVAEGLSNKEIADEAFLSEGTVRNYLSTILSKLGLRDRTQLAVFYLSGGKELPIH